MVHKIYSIANQKGGVGKTTTSINLASCFAIAEKKTLLIDMDPQGNISSGLALDYESNKTIYNALIDEHVSRGCIYKTKFKYLDIIPSNTDLVGAEIELVSFEDREYCLKKFVDRVKGDYDKVIIDCPPSLGLLTINSLVASDAVVIPIQCEYYALEGLSKLLNTFKMVKKHYNHDIVVKGILLTMFDKRLNLSKQVEDEARKFFGDKVFQTVISRNVKLSEAPSHGKSILDYDINSAGAKNYLELAKEIMQNE